MSDIGGSQHKVGVVTVTYNSANVVDEFLVSLLAQTHRDFVLFIVDNASHDDTLRRVRSCKDERVKVIANGENPGIAEGNNQGIRASLAAGCHSVLLINNDTAFGPELIQKLIDGLDQCSCEMTTPKMTYFDAPQTIWAAGGYFQPWFAYRSVHRGIDRKDSPLYSAPRQVTFSPACCILVHKTVFEKVGVMDSQYFVYGDDCDFLLRAMREGIRMWYIPDTVLLHKVSTLTGGMRSTFYVRFCTRNRVYFIRKYYRPTSALLWLLFFQVFLAFKLIRRKDSWRVYLLKQKSFWEGVKMPVPGTPALI